MKDGAPRADLKGPWRRVCRAAGLEDLRLHDLRHSFASFGAGASLGLPIIGKLLGHSQAATTHRYAHLDADPIRPIELLQAESAEAQRGVLWKRRCAIDPFANGGGHTDAIAKSIAV
jgi:integrase